MAVLVALVIAAAVVLACITPNDFWGEGGPK